MGWGAAGKSGSLTQEECPTGLGRQVHRGGERCRLRAAQGVWRRAGPGLGGSDSQLGSGRKTHHQAAELTVAEDPGGAWTLEVVILAEVALVAAVPVAHTAPALALASARAGLVLSLPQAGKCVALGARGAAAGLATPGGGASQFPPAGAKAGAPAVYTGERAS